MLKVLNSVALATTALALTFAVSATALAGTIDGCADSPENPTLLLGLLAGAAAAVPWLRTRLKRRSHKLSI